MDRTKMPLEDSSKTRGLLEMVFHEIFRHLFKKKKTTQKTFSTENKRIQAGITFSNKKKKEIKGKQTPRKKILIKSKVHFSVTTFWTNPKQHTPDPRK